MATATMGLRRRIPVNSAAASNQLGNASSTASSSSANSPSAYSTVGGSIGNKRSRSENNNSPSHGNLNSMNNGAREEPPTKKSRGTSTNSKNSGNFVTTNSTSTDSHSKTGGGRGHFTGSRSTNQTKTSASDIITSSSTSGNVLSSWSTTGSNIPDTSPYASVTGLSMTATSDQSSNNNASTGSCNPTSGSLCSPGNLGISTTIPYMSSTMATFVGNATNLVGKNSSSVSYLDISNMTSGSLGSGYGSTTSQVNANSTLDHSTKNGLSMPFPGIRSTAIPYIGQNSNVGVGQKGQGQDMNKIQQPLPKKFQNDSMFNAYQPWVIKTYGDLAKTKTITIKKYARILRTLRGEEVNSAENSKFRFWVKSKGFNIGQPEGYDAKPADRIIGRHAVTSPGLDPPLYVPTQLPHNKTLNGAEGTVPPGKVYKKVAIVENFFDIIHAVHVDLEGRPGKHAGQKRTYRTITETYAFLPREAVTRFLLGCTECQRRPRTPSPTNLANQQAQSTTTGAPTITTSTPTSTIANPAIGQNRSTSSPITLSNLNGYSKNRTIDPHPEVKNLFGYRHQRYQQKTANHLVPCASEKLETIKETEERYNPLSITNLLKKEPTPLPTSNYVTTEPTNTIATTNTTTAPTTLNIDPRRTPESDRASSKSSASSKRRRMLPEGRTPSPQPNQPLARPWSPGLDPKNTPVDYSLPITTSYLKHQQKLLLQAERDKAAAAAKIKEELELEKSLSIELDTENLDRFSPAAGLIDTNLNLLATIQHLHCQVMLALTERLRPTMGFGAPLILPSISSVNPNNLILGTEVSVQTADRS